MNKKGQVLVAFVILIPLLLLLISVVINIGYLNYEKVKIEDTLEVLLEDALRKNKTENEMKEIINDNIKASINLNYNGKEVKVNVKKKINTVFSLLKKDYDLDLSYIAYIENDKYIFKKE